MRKSFVFRFFLMMLFIIAINNRLPLHAEKIISHFYASEKPDKELEAILYLAVGIELSKAGLSSTLSGEKYDYLLHVDYAPTETGFSVRLELFSDNRPRKALSEKEFLLRLDDTLDSTTAAAVTALLAAADIDTSASGTEEIAGLLSKAPAGDLPLPDSTRAPSPVPAFRRETGSTGHTPFIDTSFSAGGLMLFGSATDYFHYGAHGALTAGYAIPVGRLALTPGLRISVTRIYTDAEVSGNPLYISTAGVNLQYGTGNDQPFRASGVVSAGGAVLSTTREGTRLDKTVPYADCGVHTGLPLGNRIFIGAEVRLLTVLDPDILFIGVVTALAINREF